MALAGWVSFLDVVSTTTIISKGSNMIILIICVVSLGGIVAATIAGSKLSEAYDEGRSNRRGGGTRGYANTYSGLSAMLYDKGFMWADRAEARLVKNKARFEGAE